MYILYFEFISPDLHHTVLKSVEYIQLSEVSDTGNIFTSQAIATVFSNTLYRIEYCNIDPHCVFKI
jgi:hypothetical protein